MRRNKGKKKGRGKQGIATYTEDMIVHDKMTKRG